MIKQLLHRVMILLIVALLLCGISASAAELTGNCGESVTWSLSEEGILTISCEGPMADYASASDAPWYSSRASVTSVVISNGVTTIGDRAFYGMTALSDVSIGSGVTSIGDYAFRGCTALTEVSIPATVTALKASAFRACSMLQTVTFGGNAPTIGNYVFNECAPSLTVQYYEGSTGYDVSPWTDYAPKALHVGTWVVDLEPTCAVNGSRHIECGYCQETITEEIPSRHVYENGVCIWCQLPEGLEYFIHYYSTDGIYVSISRYTGTLSKLVIPDEIEGYPVNAISDQAFIDCSGLNSITIPELVNRIGSYAFSGCSSLTDITIPEGLTSISGGVFRDCTSLTDIVIPNSVTSIGDSAFYGCSSLAGITIPESVTSIGKYAFRECSSLTSITIPDSVTSIGYAAFYYCIGMTDITIPAGVTRIDESVFEQCTSLTNISIPEGVTSIGGAAFQGCSSLTSVTLSDSLTSIGNAAFHGCSSLTDITIPESVSSISDYTFYGCNNLTNVIIPESVTSIGNYAFSGCTSLTSITIPDGVTSIGNSAFSCCSSLTSIVFPESITSIAYSTFSDCPLRNVYYGGMKGQCAVLDVWADYFWEYGIYVHYSCTEMQDHWVDHVIKVPTEETVGNIHRTCDCGYKQVLWEEPLSGWVDSGICGDFVYWGLTQSGTLTVYGTGNLYSYYDEYDNWGNLPWCSHQSSITAVILEEGVSNVPLFAFSSYKNMTSLSIASSVKIIRHGAFFDCESLTSVVIPEGVTVIEDEAFAYCDNLSSVVLPASLTDIRGAFYYCINMADVYFAGTEEQWAEIAGEYFYSQRIHYSCSGPEGHWTGEYRSAESTCEEEGGLFNVCLCGLERNERPVAALGHVEVVDAAVAATCTTAGLTEGKHCSRCNEVFIGQSVIDALGHNEVTDAAVAPTCTETGLTEGKHCSRCNKVFVAQQALEAVGHNYTEAVTAPTCDDSGYTTHTCLNCADSYMDNLIDPLGHDYESIVMPPLCTDAGYTTHTCSVCGDSYTDSYTDPTGRHAWVATHGSFMCMTCGRGGSAEEIEFTGTYGENGIWRFKDGILTVSPSDGTERVDYGSWYIFRTHFSEVTGANGECPDVHTAIFESGITYIEELMFYNSTIENVVIADTVEVIQCEAFALCDNLTTFTLPSGLISIESYAFLGCNNLTDVYLSASVEEIDPWAFSGCNNLVGVWVDGNNPYFSNDEKGILYNKDATKLILIPRGYEGEYIIPETVVETANHAFSDCVKLTKIVIPSSVTRMGYGGYYNCKVLQSVVYCGTQEQWIAIDQKADYTAHLQFHEGEWYTVTSPTCSEVGTDEMDCIYCQNTILREVNTLPHTPCDAVTENNVYPDCENAGSYDSVIYCAVCENEISRKTVALPATGHSYAASVTSPTCTQEGYTTYTCPCGNTYNGNEVDSLGHDWSDWETTIGATYTAEGVKSRICLRSGCDAQESEVIPRLPLLTSPIVSTLEDTTSGIRITWEKVDGAAKYRVFVKTSKGWAKLTDTIGNSYTYTAAKAGTAYTFTVRCLSADGKTYSSAYNTTGWNHTYYPIPAISGFESTPNGIKISWNLVNGAAKYRVFVKTSKGWTKLTDTSSTSYLYAGAMAGQTYTFTVRCLNADSTAFTSSYNTSGWKHTYSPTPVISDFESNANGLQINWNPINGAAKYRVFVKTSKGWTKLADTTSNSYAWTAAKTGVSYTFTVRCVNAAGTAFTSSYNTSGWKYTYAPAPQITKTESTANGIQLTWGAINGAAKYRVFVKNGTSWVKVGDTAATTFTYGSAKAGQAYTFTVRCLSADGKSFTSAYNTAGWKCTYAPVPQITTMESTTGGIYLRWNPVAGNGLYRVFVKTSNGWVKLADVEDISYQYTGAKAGQKYTFTVRKLNENGSGYASGYNSTGWTHTYNPVPEMLELDGDTNGIYMKWSAINGAAKYRVFVKTAKGWTKLADVDGNSYRYTDAKLGESYIFTVRCLSADGKSFASSYNTAGWSHTYVPTPKMTKLVNTANGIQMNWTAINGAQGYIVYIKSNGVWRKLTVVEGTGYVYTDAKPEETYTFSVCAIGEKVNSFYNGTGWSIKRK